MVAADLEAAFEMNVWKPLHERNKLESHEYDTFVEETLRAIQHETEEEKRYVEANLKAAKEDLMGEKVALWADDLYQVLLQVTAEEDTTLA